MKKTLLKLSVLLFVCTVNINAQTWRSALYPESWTPGYADSQGRFLHDFSYAGYKSGLETIPDITTPVVDITQAPYNADNTGNADITAIIQQAINDISSTGGVVYLPAGEYAMSVPSSRSYGAQISSNNIVIRGAGAGETKIKNTTTNMRNKKLFYFCPSSADWETNLNLQSALTEDALPLSFEVKVPNSELYVKGDWVLLRTDITDEFITEHNSTGYWTPSGVKGQYLCRQVVSANPLTHTLTLDAPIRYPMKTRDNARIYKLRAQLMESGMENLSIGNIQHPGSGFGEEDYNVSTTAAYQVHASHLIVIQNAINCWVKNVHTYRPTENTGDFHTLSNGIQLYHVRNITVEDCDFRNSQYEGGGGNGYMYILQGNDCLLKNCHAEGGRHNYSFKTMAANGNVLYNCVSKDSYAATDFHMHLSMANLIDNFTADGDYIDAGFRASGSTGALHMYSTTESVIWNTKSPKKFGSLSYVINSKQFGYGYVIGTSGVVTNVNLYPLSGASNSGVPYDTAPVDFTEGLGNGSNLLPQSLYIDQLEKRKERPSHNDDLDRLNVNFEGYILDTRHDNEGHRFLSFGTAIEAKVVDNPYKSGINTSDKVLRVTRSASTAIVPSRVTNRGTITDTYNIEMDDDEHIVEMKVLKTTDGKLAVGLHSDADSEITTEQLSGSSEWRLVRFDFGSKIDWSLKSDAYLNIQIEKESSPASYQTSAMTVYIDDVRIISKNNTSVGRMDADKEVKIILNNDKTLDIYNLKNETDIYLFDMIGRMMLQTKSKEIFTKLNLSGINIGYYLLKCTDMNNVSLSKKIIVR